MSDFSNKPSTNEIGIADGDRISTSPEERVIEDDQMTNSTSSITPAAFVEDEAMTSSLIDGSRVSRDITLYTLPIGDGDSSSDENTDNDEKDSLEENDVEGEIPPYEALGDDDFGDFIECPVGVMADDIDDSEEVTATIFSPRNSHRCVQPLSQEKIATIKEVMSKIQLKPRAGTEAMFRSLDQAKIRIGDELA